MEVDTTTTTNRMFVKKIMAVYETRHTSSEGEIVFDTTSETLFYVFTEDIDQTTFDSAVAVFKRRALELEGLRFPSDNSGSTFLKAFTGGYRICVFDDQDNLIFKEENLHNEEIADAPVPSENDTTSTFPPSLFETTTSSCPDDMNSDDDEPIPLFSTDELYGMLYDCDDPIDAAAYSSMLVYKGELSANDLALGVCYALEAVAGLAGSEIALIAVGAGCVVRGLGELFFPPETYYYTFTSLTVSCNGVMQGLFGYSDTTRHGPFDSIDEAQRQMELAVANAPIPDIYRNQFAETDQLIWYFNGVIVDCSNHVVRRFEQ